MPVWTMPTATPPRLKLFISDIQSSSLSKTWNVCHFVLFLDTITSVLKMILNLSSCRLYTWNPPQNTTFCRDFLNLHSSEAVFTFSLFSLHQHPSFFRVMWELWPAPSPSQWVLSVSDTAAPSGWDSISAFVCYLHMILTCILHPQKLFCMYIFYLILFYRWDWVCWLRRPISWVLPLGC